jgi:hypothetical protein
MRSFVRWVVPALALIAAVAPVSPLRAAPAAPQIHIFSCQVTSGSGLPHKDDVGLAVRFRNDGPAALTSIMWRAKYGTAPVDFIDDGTFTHDVRIDNYVLAEQGSSHFNWGGFALSAMQLAAHTVPTGSLTATNLVLPEYISTEYPENCAIVRATFDTGETWVNPDLVQQSILLTKPTPLPLAVAAQSQGDTLAPVQFSHCTLYLELKPGLDVVFNNTSSRVADRLVIRATYGKSAVDFVDEGTFAPGALVKHGLRKPITDDLRSHTYFGLDDPHDCAVVSAHFADGSTWQNPSMDATPAPPAAVPDAIDLMRSRLRWAPRHDVPAPKPSPTESAAGLPPVS